LQATSLGNFFPVGLHLQYSLYLNILLKKVTFFLSVVSRIHCLDSRY